jgi:hypothetical protein
MQISLSSFFKGALMNQSITPSNLRSLAINIMDRCRKNSLMVSFNIKIDMTKVLLKKEQSRLSLYTILSKAISDVIKSNPRYNVLNSVFIKRLIRSRLVIFKHHHFSFTFPKTFLGEEIPIIYVVHNIDKLNEKEIDEKIKQASITPLEQLPSFKTLQILSKVPNLFQKVLLIIYDLIFDPNERDGSICLNNMGKTNTYSFIGESSKTIMFCFPGVDKNNETLLTMTINHYVVDGKLCCAFADDLKIKLENLI